MRCHMGLRGLRTSYRKKERGPDEIRTEQIELKAPEHPRRARPSIASQKGRVNAESGDIASVSRDLERTEADTTAHQPRWKCAVTRFMLR